MGFTNESYKSVKSHNWKENETPTKKSLKSSHLHKSIPVVKLIKQIKGKIWVIGFVQSGKETFKKKGVFVIES